MLSLHNVCQTSAADTKDRADGKQTDATGKAIKDMLGSEVVYEYVSPYAGLAFWLASMSQDQQSKISKLPGVSLTQQLAGVGDFY